MAGKREKFKAITWGVVALAGVCLLGAALFSDWRKDSAHLPTNIVGPSPRVRQIPSLTSTPTQVESTPTSALTFLFDCIPTQNGVEMGVVTSVIDGDTIHVDIGGKDYSVRYIGIDAPERDAGDPMYEEASQKNSELVAGKNVILVRDVSETDTFDRLLRYVLVGNTFVNLELVRGGYAEAKAYPPDTACHETFKAAEPVTRSNEILLATDQPGLTPKFTPTRAVQGTSAAGSCPNGCTVESAGCSIKGNISADGEKIYHLPGMRFYADTVITASKGERWFCTEDEAVANGWRRAKR